MALDESDKEEFDEQVESLVYVATKLVDSMLVASAPRMTAKLTKAHYDEMINVGFNSEQALELTGRLISGSMFNFNK